MDRSWKRKKIPGLRCSSRRRHAFAAKRPTSVRVYVWRGSGGIVEEGAGGGWACEEEEEECVLRGVRWE